MGRRSMSQEEKGADIRCSAMYDVAVCANLTSEAVSGLVRRPAGFEPIT